MSDIKITLKRGQLIRVNHTSGLVSLNFVGLKLDDAEQVISILEVAGIISTPEMPIAAPEMPRTGEFSDAPLPLSREVPF